MAKTNVDIIIRGKDAATPAFRKISRGADRLTKNLFGIRSAAAAALAGFVSLRGASDAIEAFGVQEQAERRLADSLELLGANTAGAMDEFKQFASEIQSVTTVGDEAVLQMAALGASLGRLSGQQLKQATIAAIGLSKSLGIDTTAAMRLVARAAIGDTTTLARYGIKLDETLSPQEKFNELLRRGAEGFSIARGEAKTTTGQFEQFKNKVGDLKEQIGGALLPAVVSLTQHVDTLSSFIETRAIPFFQQWGLTIVKVGAAVVAFVGVLRLLRAAQQATAATTALLAAASGPKGWLKLGAAAGVAAAAVWGVNEAFAAVEKSASSATDSAKQLSALNAAGAAIGGAPVAGGPTSSGGQAGAGLSLVKRLHEQAQAFQMTARGAAIYKLQLQGVDQQLIKQAQSLDKFLTELETQRAAQRAGDNLIESLKLQAETFGMTSREAAIYRAELQGVTEATIDEARRLDHLLSLKERERALRGRLQSILDDEENRQTRIGPPPAAARTFESRFLTSSPAAREAQRELEHQKRLVKLAEDQKKELREQIEVLEAMRLELERRPGLAVLETL
jgi:hypothetical protein